MKTCTGCGVAKPPEEYHRQARSPDGRKAECRDCTRNRSRRYYVANSERLRGEARLYRLANPQPRDPERERARKLWQRYRMTPEQYASLLASQGGACAVCGAASCETGRAFAVDHDHRCCPGESSCGACVRALLCQACNTGIGKFKDDAALLRRAADYLEGDA